MVGKPSAEAAFGRLQAALARVETAAVRLRQRGGGDAATEARHQRLQAEVEAAVAGLDRLIAAAETH